MNDVILQENRTLKYKPGITAHVMIKNEEKWIWFAIMSVIKHVDRILIVDTGSTDKTVEIVSYLVNKFQEKIIFMQMHCQNNKEIAQVRQRMLDLNETEWYMRLDGDEIWYEAGMHELINQIKESRYPLIAAKFINCVGDVYHHKKFENMRYRIKGIFGSITLAAIHIPSFPGMYIGGDYGFEGAYKQDKTLIGAECDDNKVLVLQTPYFHTSFLCRSGSIRQDWEIPYRRDKVFAKWDYVVTKDIFNFPEVFSLERPNTVQSPFYQMGMLYYLLFALNKIINCFGKSPIYFIKKLLSKETFKRN